MIDDFRHPMIEPFTLNLHGMPKTRRFMPPFCDNEYDEFSVKLRTTAFLAVAI